MTVHLSQVAISKFVSQSPRFHFSLTLTLKISGASTSSLLSGTFYKLVLRIHYRLRLIRRGLLNGQVIFVLKIIQLEYKLYPTIMYIIVGLIEPPFVGWVSTVGNWAVFPTYFRIGGVAPHAPVLTVKVKS